MDRYEIQITIWFHFLALGGTADITLHQQELDGTLSEVIPTSGGAWGGINVDNAFIRFLEKVFSAEVLKELKSGEIEAYNDLIFEFEVKKRSIRSDTTSDIMIKMPMGLIDLTKKHYGGINAAIKQSSYVDFVSLSGLQKLCVNPQTFRDLFKPTIDELLKHLKKNYFDEWKVHTASKYYYDRRIFGMWTCTKSYERYFSWKKNILIDTPGLAVLKGAVLYGHNSKQMSRRILKKTYGIQSWTEFDPDIHPETKRVRINGTDRCQDVFLSLVVKGEQIEAGHTEVLDSEIRSKDSTVYVSDDTNPRYVTDPSCQRLGNLIVPLPPGESDGVENVFDIWRDWTVV